jgi:mRNA-degrading endonuclease RelE of RelBE toxin-antitoxin system
MYDLFIEPDVHAARQELPGHVRQRVRRLIDALETDPRPFESRDLGAEDLDLPVDVEMRRIRLDRWRIVYAVNDAARWVWVLGIYRRPPYRYDDLPKLARKITNT